jgi:dTDP-4-amino-4,6-dideoxygalactose transaminase
MQPIVPFTDIEGRIRSHRREYTDAVEEVLGSCDFAGGRHVADFEEDFATYCGTRRAVGVGSGTEALWLALLAMDIGPGDEVITTPMTFAATAEAILLSGAQPVFADIDPASWTIDPEQVARAITPRTRAVVPVHLFGRMADMARILRIARRHGLRVIEDAAQAHGAMSDGRRAGSIGDAGCFSFYPTKNLAAIGDAGAITTDDEGICDRLRSLRHHGQQQAYHHPRFGWNARMDGIHAAVLSRRLPHLDTENHARNRIASAYDHAFAGIPGLGLQAFTGTCHHARHLYVVRSRHRDALATHLARQGVETRVHYPQPLHLQGAFAPPDRKPGSLPVAEDCAREFLSLPLYPELGNHQIETVISAVRSFQPSAKRTALAAAP